MKKIIDWGDDNDFIENYNRLRSSRKMAKIYGCDKVSVLSHAKKIGFDTSQFIPIVDDKTRQIIVDSYNSKSSRELSEELNVPAGTITKIWHDHDLRGKTRKGHIRKQIQGERFGKLVVLNMTDDRDVNGNIIWECQCDCGNKAYYPSAWLVENKVVSCGCVGKNNLLLGRKLRHDLTDEVFGKLTVLHRCENVKCKDGSEATQWVCRCECGRLTKVTSGNLTTGNTKSCGFCNNKSKGELKIESILKQHNISFVREKRFDSCRYKNKLSFDFYIDDSYCLEYDGRCHFGINSIWDFEYAQLRDKIKNQWCVENNMPLIRIPYTHFENITIDDLLLETSKFIYTNADNKSDNIGEG